MPPGVLAAVASNVLARATEEDKELDKRVLRYLDL